MNLLAGTLPGEGDRAHVVSLGGRGHYAPVLEAHGVPVDSLGIGEGVSLASAVRHLRRIVRRARPELIQGWMYHGSLAASVAGMFAGRRVPVAWNIRQSLYDIGTEKTGTRWVIRALTRLSRRPRAIVYNSHQARAHHEDFGFAPARGVVIVNGFDAQRWRPDAQRRRAVRGALGLGDDDLLLGFVGRYHPIKDVPTFLDACARAMAAERRLHVALVGEGLNEENPALASGFARLPAERVHMLGRRSDIEAVMAAFDLFCLSSASEGFPNVLGEAMATGLPCIATDVGDCARVLGGHGRIVPPGDAATMANSISEICQLTTEERQAIGAAARQRIVDNYGFGATLDANRALYDTLTKRDA
ncbi:Glycosyl transferase group 1 [Sphingopyxis granuli]|uniref:Glycosyl transferase group 1 n=1 Tax=Sphingopyxis granuli TaxID=267128 RepID=A0AA86GNQ0_9SPHN|nr:glycosyltransferase [Sphingopyxis granuli]AMG74732.1 Glycosyl transferase group 1 [Sphingopyxis granuli]